MRPIHVAQLDKARPVLTRKAVKQDTAIRLGDRLKDIAEGRYRVRRP